MLTKIKKGDIIVVLAVLALAGAVYLYNYISGMSGGDLYVEVRVDGEIVDTFSLDEDIDKEYDTEFGHNHLVISDGEVSVVEADCGDLICVETNPGNRNGDAIVCVPNRFSVEVIGGEESEVDAIAQ